MAEEKQEEHLLQNEWVLWEHRAAGQGGSKNSNWKENMSELCHFQTVEAFWRNFNFIPKPSEVFYDGECRKKVGPEGKTIEEYSLFKRGIEPEWGDKSNVTGGEWRCRQYLESQVLDLYWLNLVMAVVGEVLEDAVQPAGGNSSSSSSDLALSDVINGARVVDKSRGNMPLYSLELWIKTRDADIKNKIRDRLVEIMVDGQPAGSKIHPKFEWKDHNA